MKNKKLIISLAVVALLSLILFLFLRSNSSDTTPITTPVVSLPINTIPVTERPFLTLTPDSTGRTLTLALDNTEVKEVIEYELVYQAGTKQEGVFGRLNLASEKLPIEKDLLLGSRSAGGKTTYHEDVTSGSLTLSYGETKLKESFNFLRFDPSDPVMSSPDARFSIEFTAKAMAADKVVVTMKTFGYPADLPTETSVKAGPYSYRADSVKGDVVLSIRLPAGEHINPTIYEYDAVFGDWVALKTILTDDTVSATAISGSTFIVTSE
ncbi:hypothetical protein HN588_15270 [Candidatus Bathyarchaeota archaeon]|jgi:hypothetical protein|nr:hypothetical protein [Candidatus Bathyarchaeota archaeon]